MALYTFNVNDSITFKNANGKSGRLGPTLSDCQSEYTTVPFTVTNNNHFDVSNGIQIFTIPVSGTYKIKAAGARGGRIYNYTQTNPWAYYPSHVYWRNPVNTSTDVKGTAGYGAWTEGEFTFTGGEKIAILVGQHGQDIGVDNAQRAGGGGGASWVCNEARTTLYCVGGGAGGANAGWRNNRERDVPNWEPGANGGIVNDNGTISITSDVSYRNLAPGMYNAPNGVGGYYCTNHQSNSGGGAGWGTSNGTGTEADGTGDGHGGSRWLPFYGDAAGQPTGGGGGYNTQRTYPGGNANLAEDHFYNINYNDKKYPPYHYVNSTAHSSPPPSSQATLGGWTDSQFWAGYQKYYGRPQEPSLSYPNGAQHGWSPYTARTGSSSLWHSDYRAGTGGISPCANQSLGSGFTAATGRVRRWPDDAVPGAGGVPGYTNHGDDRRELAPVTPFTDKPPAWSFRFDTTVATTQQKDSEGGFGGGGANSNQDAGGGGGYTGGAAARISNAGGRGGTSRNNSTISTPIFGLSNLDDGEVIITLLTIPDNTSPIISKTTQNLSGSNQTPSFTFTSNEAGTIVTNPPYAFSPTQAISGSNTITFITLPYATYNIRVTVEDAANNESDFLTIPSFTIAPDNTSPIISTTTQNLSGTNKTPSFTFDSNEAGTIVTNPSYAFSQPQATIGPNTITFNTLPYATYNIQVTVKDAANNVSNILTIPSFTIAPDKYVSHVFTSDGIFKVPKDLTVDFLIVGGGGGGGQDRGGGGGGGAVIVGVDQSLNTGTYQVIVGKGGKGTPAQGHFKINSGSNGGNSSFNGYIANGGGYGGSGYFDYAPTYGWGNDGGCGGGGSGYNSANAGDGRNGESNQNQYSGSTGITVYSNDGGKNGTSSHYSGGGGGAGADGTQSSSGQIPNGGDGIQNNFYNGINYYWAGGGGGAGYTQDGGNGGKGGGGGGGVGTTTGGEGINYGRVGGGGDRNAVTNKPGGDAGTNTGGGGGGGSHYSIAVGGDGGSGIVIIRYKKDKHNKLSIYRGLTNNISTNNFTDLEREGLQLEFVVGVNGSSSPTMWKPIFASNGNDITKTCNSAGDGDSIDSANWSYDLTNGFTQVSDYGLKVWAYVNDAIMSSFDDNINSVLTYEIWIKLTNDNDFRSDVADNTTRGWLMSYETGNGPAITLKDSRTNSGNSIGTFDSGIASSGFDSGYYGNEQFKAQFGTNGSHGQPKDGWDHIVGYWHHGGGTGSWTGGDKDNIPPFSSPGGAGCYINKYNIWQNVDYGATGILNKPVFDSLDRQLTIGNYYSGAINHSTYNTKGISVYSFRIWYKKLDQSQINKLYEAGPKGVVSDV